MYSNILIATDGSTLAAKAVSHGIALAKAMAASVTAVYVTEPFHWVGAEMSSEVVLEFDASSEQEAKHILSSVAKLANAAGVECEALHIRNRLAFEGIIDTAKSKKCDLVVMASHGRKGIASVVLGSQTIKVLTHSNIPLLVYR